MLRLKPISAELIPSALERALRYRLLNEPLEAESICLDVLKIDPENQEALVTLLLSLTDQFDEDLAAAVKEARAVLPRFKDEYSRLYYDGVICERQAKANLKRGGVGAHYVAYDWFVQAMDCYERAEKIRPPGNDEAVLRWNTCARILMRHAELAPHPAGAGEFMLE
jgi:tetratricopeptide (TPR) repeat protein